MGTLSFDEDGSPVAVMQGDAGLLERLQGTLSTAEGFIHGEARYDFNRPTEERVSGGSFTLFGPLPFTYFIKPGSVTTIELAPPLAIFGDHIDAIPRHRTAVLEINTLPLLLDRGFIQTKYESSHLRIDLDQWSANAPTDFGSIEVHQGITESWGRERVVATRQASIEARAGDAMLPEQWSRQVQAPLEALFTLLLNRQATTSYMGFWPDRHSPEFAPGLSIHTKGILPAADRVPERDIALTDALANFREGEPVAFEALIPRWLTVWERHRNPISLLLSDLGPQASPELRFLTRAQATEGLHRGSTSFAQTTRSSDDHDQLLSKVKALDLASSERKWVLDRVQWNEPSFRRRLMDLCKPVEDTPLGLILGGGRRTRELVSIIVATRNKLTHQLPDSTDDESWTTDYELAVLAEVLGVLMLTHIFNWLGVEFTDQADTLRGDRRFRFANDHFQPLLHQKNHP